MAAGGEVGPGRGDAGAGQVADAGTLEDAPPAPEDALGGREVEPGRNLRDVEGGKDGWLARGAGNAAAQAQLPQVHVHIGGAALGVQQQPVGHAPRGDPVLVDQPRAGCRSDGGSQDGRGGRGADSDAAPAQGRGVEGRVGGGAVRGALAVFRGFNRLDILQCEGRVVHGADPVTGAEAEGDILLDPPQPTVKAVPRPDGCQEAGSSPRQLRQGQIRVGVPFSRHSMPAGLPGHQARMLRQPSRFCWSGRESAGARFAFGQPGVVPVGEDDGRAEAAGHRVNLERQPGIAVVVDHAGRVARQRPGRGGGRQGVQCGRGTAYPFLVTGPVLLALY